MKENEFDSGRKDQIEKAISLGNERKAKPVLQKETERGGIKQSRN